MGLPSVLVMRRSCAGGDREATTLMVRNIPNAYTRGSRGRIRFRIAGRVCTLRKRAPGTSRCCVMPSMQVARDGVNRPADILLFGSSSWLQRRHSSCCNPVGCGPAGDLAHRCPSPESSVCRRRGRTVVGSGATEAQEMLAWLIAAVLLGGGVARESSWRRSTGRRARPEPESRRPRPQRRVPSPSGRVLRLSKSAHHCAPLAAPSAAGLSTQARLGCSMETTQGSGAHRAAMLHRLRVLRSVIQCDTSVEVAFPRRVSTPSGPRGGRATRIPLGGYRRLLLVVSR